MVLQKVGEFQTTINVNGEQKVATLQSGPRTFDLTDFQNVTVDVNGTNRVNQSINSDSNFDITESLNVDINVNGSNRVNQSINSDSNFDITESLNVDINVNGSGKVNDSITSNKTYNLTDSQPVDIQVNGTNEGSFSQSGSGTYNVPVNTSSLSWEEVASVSDFADSFDEFQPTESRFFRLILPDDSFYSPSVYVDLRDDDGNEVRFGRFVGSTAGEAFAAFQARPEFKYKFELVSGSDGKAIVEASTNEDTVNVGSASLPAFGFDVGTATQQ